MPSLEPLDYAPSTRPGRKKWIFKWLGLLFILLLVFLLIDAIYARYVSTLPYGD